ncbi:MAG: Gp138 family membrane-puncturing spike protein, partial [Rhabdochlamydiaceae bacterium]
MTTMTDAMRQAVLFQLYDVHTALPGQIISYDYSIQKATIQPCLKKSYLDGTTQEMPILNNVPVIFPRAGEASLTFPVSPGDTCLLLFIERSTDLWKSVGGVVAPNDPRKFDLSDAVAIMGLLPFSENSLSENNEDVLLTYKNSSIRIKASGDIQIETASKVAIGNTSAEVLDIVSSILGILITSVTTAPGSPIFQGVGPTYASLKLALDSIK